MYEGKLGTFFVSEKISCVRWVVNQFETPSKFISGSWDSPKNFLRLWTLDNKYSNTYSEFEAKCLGKVSFKDDINEVEWFHSKNLIVGTSAGYAAIVGMDQDANKLQLKLRSEQLHKFDSGNPASCTALSTFDKNIVTVGEDGKLNFIEGNMLVKTNTMTVDSCALTAVCYINPQEILCTSRMGMVKVFDSRCLKHAESALSFMISYGDVRKSNYVSCLTYHPTQKHIVLAGSEEGSISVLDLRYPGSPASYLSAHTSCVTAIGFQKSGKSQLLTASENGELWQWNQNSTFISSSRGSHYEPVSDMNPWLNAERAKSQISVTSLISDQKKALNKFDSYDSRIICGGDSEAVYFVESSRK